MVLVGLLRMLRQDGLRRETNRVDFDRDKIRLVLDKP